MMSQPNPFKLNHAARLKGQFSTSYPSLGSSAPANLMAAIHMRPLQGLLVYATAYTSQQLLSRNKREVLCAICHPYAHKNSISIFLFCLLLMVSCCLKWQLYGCISVTTPSKSGISWEKPSRGLLQTIVEGSHRAEFYKDCCCRNVSYSQLQHDSTVQKEDISLGLCAVLLSFTLIRLVCLTLQGQRTRVILH